MPEIPDEEIARRARTDPDAFGPLVARYELRLDRYLSRLGLARKEDREDVLQNVFIKAYMNLNGFDPALSFSSWVYRIAHNEAMSFFRRSRARPQADLGEAGEAILAGIADEEADTTAMAERRLAQEELARAFGMLTPREREVLSLRYIEGRSYAEMADILELPLGTVSTLIYRAKRALRAALPQNLYG